MTQSTFSTYRSRRQRTRRTAAVVKGLRARGERVAMAGGHDVQSVSVIGNALRLRRVDL